MTSDATLATTHVLHWCVSAGLWADKAGLFTYMWKKKRKSKGQCMAAMHGAFIPFTPSSLRLGNGKSRRTWPCVRHYPKRTVATDWPLGHKLIIVWFSSILVRHIFTIHNWHVWKWRRKKQNIFGHIPPTLQHFLKHLSTSCINIVVLTDHEEKYYKGQ